MWFGKDTFLIVSVLKCKWTQPCLAWYRTVHEPVVLDHNLSFRLVHCCLSFLYTAIILSFKINSVCINIKFNGQAWSPNSQFVGLWYVPVYIINGFFLVIFFYLKIFWIRQSNPYPRVSKFNEGHKNLVTATNISCRKLL